MTDNEIDEVLKSAPVPQGPHAEALGRITASLQSDLSPVRPLPASWILSAASLTIAAAVALAGAARSGFSGFEKMDWLQRTVIFCTLGIFTWAAGSEFVNSMIPGSRRRISPRGLLLTATVALAAMFALLFRDYHTRHFLSAGIVCLVIGVIHAVPVGLLTGLLLRRGFAVDPVSAGFLAGILGGLAGVGVLELHCPNFQAAHVLVWHTAVVPVCGAIGALCVSAWRGLAARLT